MPETNEQLAKRYSIKAIGIGGLGTSIIKSIAKNFYSAIPCLCIESDKTSIKNNEAIETIYLSSDGRPWTGVGGSYLESNIATKERQEDICKFLNETDLLFIFVGLGGVTGSGGVQALLEIIKNQNIKPLLFFTTPFSNESQARLKNAKAAKTSILKSKVSFIEFNNNKFAKLNNTSILDTKKFSQANSIIYPLIANCTESIYGSINQNGLINVDINDLGEILNYRGPVAIGSAKASGTDRALVSIKKTISNSYLTGLDLSGSEAIFICINAARNIKMKEVNSIMSAVKDYLDDKTQILLSVIFDESMRDEIKTTILASGIGESKIISQKQILDVESNAYLLKQKVDEADRKIKVLQNQLATATSVERRVLEDTLNKERQLRELAEHSQNEATKNLEAHKNEILRLKNDLEGRINKSIDAIKNSLVTTDGNIKSYSRWSSTFRTAALICFCLSIAPILWLSCAVLVPSIQAHSEVISTVKELGYLSLISISLPVAILLTIGTTLLRHDSKLINEIQGYTEQKHQIERLAGLLQSAQYAAQDLNKSKDYVEETFTLIRNRLITLTTDGHTAHQKTPESLETKANEQDLKTLLSILETIKNQSSSKT